MVVLVTGCRSGFGLGIAEDLGHRGHTVYAGLRDLSTAGELIARTSAYDVHPVQLDVTLADERQAVVAQILDEQGSIDALVNNAGVALGGFLEQVDEDELRRVLDVNVVGAWALTKLVLPSFRERRAGKIVMVSSVSGIMALPGLGVYATSKFALEGMTEAWRHELAHFGIDIYLVEPGAYRTDIWARNRAVCRKARDPDSPWAALSQTVDQNFQAAVDRDLRDPKEVVDKITALLEGQRQGLRHALGPGTRLRRALKIAPFWVVERAVRRRLMGARRGS
ncbi:MAG: SDR family NAD(P)-dependent oxidoreductase [Myxococcota bacterium]